jgi:RND superfamily putative drug exporter
VMKLLGDWNWYLPSWLEWLPRIGDEGEAPGTGQDQPSTGEDGLPEEGRPAPVPA